MSGQKISYARITEQEYRRLMNSAREVENIENRVSRQLKQRESQMRRDFDRQLSNINRRNQKQENMIQNLGSTMQSMEKDFQNNLNRLDNKINRVDYKVETLINDIKIKEQNKEDQATQWLKNASDSLDILDTYNHNKFTPNRYQELQDKLELSKSNIQNGVWEASISTSQTVWQDAFKLRLELEELENEWSEYLRQAIESNNELLATCDAQTTVELAFDTENEETQLAVDINHWCNGELNMLKNRALEHQKELKNSEGMKVEDFKTLLQQSAELKADTLELTQKAKDAIILSQLRSDMASDIVESLDDSGFELIDSCFEGDDERGSIHLKMQNISGDEVVTIITPMENRKNKLDIHFFDDSDEAFKKTRLQSMMDRLTKSGVECSQPQCAEGTALNNTGDERVRNFEKVKNLQRG